MMLQRLSSFVLWGAVAGAVVACEDDGGTPTEQPPLAFVRYVNFVSDTGPLNFRVVDVLVEAPATFGATFRTGGSPIAVGAETAPPYQAVAAGTRRIKVFNSDTIPANAQQEHLDTTFTFEANRFYTFALHGFARTGQTPRLRALITADPTPPTLAANQFAIRVLSFAPSLAGATLAAPTLADTTARPDAFFIEEFGIAPSGAPGAVNVAYLDVAQPYAVLDTGRYRVALTPTGTTSPVFAQAHVPPGAAGASRVPGSLAPGSVLTAVILPRSVVGSKAPQTRPTLRATDTTVAEASRRMFRSNDTVTVQSGSISLLRNRSPARPDSTVGTTGTGVSTGITCTTPPVTGSLQCPARDVILVTGATEPEYNGWHVVVQVADTLICNPVDITPPGVDTQTQCAATNVTQTTRFRFRYRIAGAPASPATGPPVYRIYPPSTVADYMIPYVSFLVDRRP